MICSPWILQTIILDYANAIYTIRINYWDLLYLIFLILFITKANGRVDPCGLKCMSSYR
jgi:hypothetical protein